MAVGRKLVTKIIRNKLAEDSAPGLTAQFEFFTKASEHGLLGLNVGFDVTSAGTLSGVIEKGGAWFKHSVFPKGQLQGEAAVDKFIRENPEAYYKLRDEIIHAQQEGKELAKPALEAVE